MSKKGNTININTAIARLMSEIIMADDVIDKKELGKFRNFCLKDKYFTDKNVLEARNVTLEEAIDCIAEFYHDDALRLKEQLVLNPKYYTSIGNVMDRLNNKNQFGNFKCKSPSHLSLVELLTKTYDLSFADGKCKLSEGIIAIALFYRLFKDYRVFSVDLGGIEMDNMTVLYLEDCGKELSALTQIQKEYRQITNEFKLMNMHFIHIPKITDKFKASKKENTVFIDNLLSFMHPEWSEEEKRSKQKALSEISTQAFCRNKLHGSLGIPVCGVTPSFLVKMGDTETITPTGKKKKLSNFLLIKLEWDKNSEGRYAIVPSITQQVSRFCCDLRRFVTTIVITREHGETNFRYSGFSKTFFDMCVNDAEEIRSDSILFDCENTSISFPSKNITIKMTPKPFAVYLLAAYRHTKNIDGGLPTTMPDDVELAKTIKREYTRICTDLIPNRKDIRDEMNVYKSNNLGKNIHDVNKFLTEYDENAPLQDKIKNKEYYSLENYTSRNGTHYYSMRVRRDLILIRKPGDTEPVKLLSLEF